MYVGLRVYTWLLPILLYQTQCLETFPTHLCAVDLCQQISWKGGLVHTSSMGVCSEYLQ